MIAQLQATDNQSIALVFLIATAGNDNLFISNYQLYLPTKEQLEEFIQKEMKLLE